MAKDMSRERWLQLAGQETYSPDDITEMLETGDIVECAACGEYSAFAYELANAYEDGDSMMPPEKGLVAHVGTASGWEFECGHCKAHNVKADAAILHPAYTHSED